jgi:hypothetical protein
MKEESTMFSKKPSFDESPLQDLSEDQMNQVSGGSDSSYKKDWNWKHRHHHHHRHHMKNNTVKVEVIVVIGGKKYTYWEDAPSSKW